MSDGNAKTYSDNNKLDAGSLEYAAKWIENSLIGETNERVIEFGKNMSMSIRAAKPSDSEGSVTQKEFCPNCEAEVPCTHEAELYVCDICGEDFAKYIVSRNCSVSDVSMTQDVLTDIKTGQSIEKETCSWIQEDDPEICYWKTGCGNSFYFTEGTPTDNNMKYCCYCGKLLKQED